VREPDIRMTDVGPNWYNALKKKAGDAVMAPKDFVTDIQNLFPSVKRYLEAEEARELTGLQATPTQMNALLVVALHPHLTMGELSEELHLTESSCTRLVDRLVDSNLIRRKSDENDRRVVRLHPSSYGKQLASLVIDRRTRRFQELASKLTAEEQDMLLVSLQAVLRSFRQLERERKA